MDFSPSLSSRALAFFETLIQIIPPRSVSDRTCFRRIAEWLKAEVRAGRFEEQEIFEHVLLYAREASLGAARNPAAVFVSILKKELHYDPAKAQR